MGRVLIIGLDGATFDLIRPWAAEGRLPNLARLLAEGAAGELRSTVPPMSPPAWSSFMTGKNPGKHGIFDFTERKPGTYEIQFVSSRHRKAETIWQILSRAGRRVCVVGVPTTYPVEAVNGVMISGFDAPMMNDKAIHPPGLLAEIREKVGEYFLSSSVTRYVYDRKLDLAVDTMLQGIRRKADVAKYLWTKEPWDCFMAVFGETDNAAHYFWGVHDARSPHHVPLPAGSRHPDPILSVYQALDEVVGEFVGLTGADITLVLMSDHGTGGTGDRAVRVNRWLEANGLLRFRHGGAGGPFGRLRMRVGDALMGKVLSEAKAWWRRLPRGVRKRVGERKAGLAGRVESLLRLSGIDWRATRAFSDESPHYPNISINVRGREPGGIVEPGAEYEALRDDLIHRLTAWRDPETGQPVVERVWRREEIYGGPEVCRAPDLVIAWALDRGYSYVSRPSAASWASAPIGPLGSHEPGLATFMLRHVGDHRDNGIFLLRGRGVKPGAVPQDPRITDLAPTLLHLLAQPVPPDMDGRVLVEVFEPDHLARHPVHHEPAGASGSAEDLEGYSEEESEMIRKRLQDLGYVE